MITIRAQLCRRKKVPSRGPEIDARDNLPPSRSRKPRRLDGVFYWSRLRLNPRGDGTMTDLTDLQADCRACGCPWSRRFATANSTSLRCAGWSGIMRRGPVDGLILAATSGEGMTLGIGRTRTAGGGDARPRSPAAGATCRSASACPAPAPRRCCDTLDETAAWPIDGYLIASPYYTRPSQRGLLQHFTALADHASWPIVLYNIPYRTAVNIDQRDAAAARRASQHRRHEGLLRRPRAVDRLAARGGRPAFAC